MVAPIGFVPLRTWHRHLIRQEGRTENVGEMCPGARNMVSCITRVCITLSYANFAMSHNAARFPLRKGTIGGMCSCGYQSLKSLKEIFSFLIASLFVCKLS